MRRNRVLYGAGLMVGLIAIFALVPRARETAQAVMVQWLGRARQAWEEGRKAKRRREDELEEAVLGSKEPGATEQEAPDYIV